jgi:hypothetical protein
MFLQTALAAETHLAVGVYLLQIMTNIKSGGVPYRPTGNAQAK